MSSMKDPTRWETKTGMLYILPEQVKAGQHGTYKIIPPCFKGHPFDNKVGYVEAFINSVLVKRTLVMVEDTEGYVNAIKELGYTKDV